MNRREFIEASLSASAVAGHRKGNGKQGPGNDETRRSPAPDEDSRLLKPHSIRIYNSLLNPSEHPDFERRHVRPPGWPVFGNHTHFTTLRGFEIEKNRIVNFAETIRKYTEVFRLGDIVWPSYPILFAENLDELVEEIRQRDLFLFDIWGYVPGSGPGGYWKEFRPPTEALKVFDALKERWLGMDNGEQDGRYIGSYASQMYPGSASRPQQYFNFHRHFEKLTGELGNRMTALVSLTFGHYFLKEGLYCLIGGETAQALPNGQVMYAFIRGAGKQHGVPWFGNASVWNRWGWKEYGPPRHDGSHEGGPEKGTSLSLLKRLMYSQILYNSVSVGFESGWFEANSSAAEHTEPKLSPIGVMQRAAKDWVEKEGQPGTMMVPFALVLDFFAGWTVPRHLYSSNAYRVWGNLPYGPGDYWTDALLDMFYPGYQNSSYYHDESGFMAATPYGDAVDCLLSDSPGWLLARYPLLVLAGGLRGGAELRDKLQAYLAAGGLLLTTAANLKEFPGGLAGVRVSGPARRFKPTVVAMGQDNRAALREDSEFDLYPLSFPSHAAILAKCDGHPAAVSVVHGKGRLIVLASPFGLSARPSSEASAKLAQDVSNEIDGPLAKPYVLLKHVRRILDLAFESQMLFKVGSNVSFIVCRKGKGEYRVGIFNNSWKEQPFRIEPCCGQVESIQEIHLDRSEKTAVGYLPEGIHRDRLGTNGKDRIAGGDVRIFSIRLSERGVGVIPHIVPPSRPLRRALPIRNALLIKEEILKRPTFFQNYDSVVVDWKYLWERKPDALRKEAQWIGLQNLRVIVDLTSGIDLYPQLRLIDNSSRDYADSLAVISDVLDKMQILRARDLILSLHRFPENNFTSSQSWESFTATVRGLCKKAAQAQIALHLRMAPGKPPATLKEAISFLNGVGSANFFLAPSVALIPAEKRRMPETKSLLRGKVGLWLVSSAEKDISGRVWSANSPLPRSSSLESLRALLDVAPDAPVVFDCVYANHDEEYLDVRTLRDLLQPGSNS